MAQAQAAGPVRVRQGVRQRESALTAVAAVVKLAEAIGEALFSPMVRGD